MDQRRPKKKIPKTKAKRSRWNSFPKFLARSRAMVWRRKSLFDRLEYLIVKITILILALIAAIKLIAVELRFFFF